jgi:5-oxoprolinase (ATP-hydrolysing) subunit C
VNPPAPASVGRIEVLKPGHCTRIVDAGRPGSRALGVPIGGAADRRSLALGNALVGNPPTTAALEISLAGPQLRADVPLACVLFGAPFHIDGDQHPDGLHTGTTFTLQPGETLSIGGTARGVRAYFCVRGGLGAPSVLGSESSLGPLATGQTLACEPGEIRSRFLPATDAEEAVVTLRVIPGPQADWFEPEDVFRQTFEVTPASNRMGLRLRGEALTFRAGVAPEMVSEPVAPGAVQVTRDGQCIVLGVDGQTIGGYPKVAHVVAADLDRLGQLRPGEAVRFIRVRLDEATQLYRAHRAEIDAWIMRLQTTL